MWTLTEWRKSSRDAGDAKVSGGEWAKIGKSHYRQVTGKEIRKTDRGWETNFDRCVWPSRWAAMSAAGTASVDAI